MRTSLFFVASLSSTFLTIPNTLIADVAAVEACETVYLNAVRNHKLRSDETSRLSFIYNLHCNSDGSIKEGTTTASLDVSVFSYGDGAADFYAKNSEQRHSEFCKLGQERGFSSQSNFSLSDLVAVDATANFNQCLEIAKTGNLVISHKTTGSSVTIRGKRTNPKLELTIDGLSYDKSIFDCSSTSFSGLTGSKKNLHGAFREVPKDGTFAIICDRKKSKEGFIKKGQITLVTSEVSYVVDAPADRFLGFHLASEAEALYSSALNRALTAEAEVEAYKTKLETSSESIAEKNAEIETLRASLKDTEAKQPFAVVGYQGSDNFPPDWQVEGYSATRFAKMVLAWHEDRQQRAIDFCENNNAKIVGATNLVTELRGLPDKMHREFFTFVCMPN